jgi:hypothetical protein
METLTEIMKVRPLKIQEINNNLNSFIDGLAEVLENYSLELLVRQVNLRKHDIYSLLFYV